jgi:hypothetical protein
MISFEIALPIGAIAFFLYDSSTLLFGNELLYVRRGSRWSATGGLNLYLFGKRVCLPALFSPHALIFRVAWSEGDARTGSPAEWPPPSLISALRPVQYICGALYFALLVLLPVISIALGAGALLLLLFGAYYSLTLAAVVVAYFRRGALGLTGKAFWLLALDVLACPPFAVNLVRRITLRFRLEGSPLAFANSHFEPRQREHVVAIIASRIEEFLAQEDSGSENASKLIAFREQLRGEL